MFCSRTEVMKGPIQSKFSKKKTWFRKEPSSEFYHNNKHGINGPWRHLWLCSNVQIACKQTNKGEISSQFMVSGNVHNIQKSFFISFSRFYSFFRLNFLVVVFQYPEYGFADRQGLIAFILFQIFF